MTIDPPSHWSWDDQYERYWLGLAVAPAVYVETRRMGGLSKQPKGRWGIYRHVPGFYSHDEYLGDVAVGDFDAVDRIVRGVLREDFARIAAFMGAAG